MARKALSRVKDVPLLQLIARVAAAQRQGTSEVLLRAEVLAHCGKFQDAAKAYTSAGGVLQHALIGRAAILQGAAAGRWPGIYVPQSCCLSPVASTEWCMTEHSYADMLELALQGPFAVQHYHHVFMSTQHNHD